MPTLLHSLHMTLLAARNALDYPLRRLMGYSRKGFRLAGGLNGSPDPVNLYAYLPGGQRERAVQLASGLLARYDLARLAADATPTNFRENLFYLHMLENALNACPPILPDGVLAADIGASHWFYVQALRALISGWMTPTPRRVHLTGFETDPHRVYADGYSRMDHAVAHMRGLPGLTYTPSAFVEKPQTLHLCTMLFPFVFVEDHLRWGLPRGAFNPQGGLLAAWHSLAPGGLLIIANQGEAEHTAQRRMLDELSIPVSAAFHQDPLLFAYPLERYVLCALKPSTYTPPF